MLDQARIRFDAIVHVLELRRRWIGVPGRELNQFESQGETIHLRGPQGIFKPRELDEPLTILSSLASSYRDEAIEGNRVRYGFLPESREFDNDGLKRAAEFGLPLVYLLQVGGEPSPEYEVFAPVHVVSWDDRRREFVVDLSGAKPDAAALGELPPPRDALQLPLMRPAVGMDQVRDGLLDFGETAALVRISKAHFRREVLRAYRDRCAVCGLHHRALLDALELDAAGDSGPRSARHGIALCETHLRAMGIGLMRIGEDYTIVVDLPPGLRRRPKEAAMLIEFDGARLRLPEREDDWPVSAMSDER